MAIKKMITKLAVVLHQRDHFVISAAPGGVFSSQHLHCLLASVKSRLRELPGSGSNSPKIANNILSKNAFAAVKEAIETLRGNNVKCSCLGFSSQQWRFFPTRN
ncbi:hypothetical protein F2Q69_00046940 [Brassica cretica]|uniref:Uncharacterized protein n=4 Tax=Brassica TaxID=3705 RepID=A0A8S9PQH5_BRACR|nr:hypothetical protein F2Q69_00046940 [Brassica cretica]